MGNPKIIYRNYGKDQTAIRKGFSIAGLLKLPHISRGITASPSVTDISWFLTMMLVVLSVFNLVFEIYQIPDTEKQLQLSILKNPTDSKLHEKLGEYYLKINSEAAKREFDLAQEYFKSSLTPPINILGIETEPIDRLREITNTREKLQKEINYWENLKKLYPDYNYATLKTAVLYYQLDDRMKTNDLMKSLLWQMPGDKTVHQIVEKLKM